jgi:hypothetical protein
VLAVCDAHQRGLHFGMAEEVYTGRARVEGPVVLAVARGMNAGEATAFADVGFESRLLTPVEHRAGGVQEDDGFVVRQIGGSELRGVFSGGNAAAIRTMLRPSRIANAPPFASS